jgi:RHS repeat-associated protein
MGNIRVNAFANGPQVTINTSGSHCTFTGEAPGNNAGIALILSSPVQPLHKQLYYNYDCTGNRTIVQGDSAGSFPAGICTSATKYTYNNQNELTEFSAGGAIRFQGSTVNPIKSAAVNVTETATIAAGTITAGDTLSIVVHDSTLSTPETASYTVQSGDSTTSIATGLKDVVNANNTLQSLGVTATSSGPVVTLTSLSTNATTYTTAESSGATESITLEGNVASGGAIAPANSFVANPFLTAGANIASLTAVSGGGTTAINSYPIFVASTAFAQSTNAGASETITLLPTAGGATATIDGSKSTDDVLSITAFDLRLPGGAEKVSYTVLAGDTLSSIASGLATAINNDSALQALNVSAAANSTVMTITASNVSTALSYDANGNMTLDGTNSYSWDAENRLIQITYPGSGNNTQFTYDPLGRPVKIVETSGGSVTSTKQFVGNEERDGSGNLVRQYFGLGQVNFTGGTGTPYFLTVDHLGSAREMTDSSGNIVAQYGYDPYGQATKLQGSLDADFQYAGMYMHGRSGLNLTWFRQYSSQLGRWLSRDPIGESAGSNLYSYCGNNPMSGIDTLGLDAGYPWMADPNAPQWNPRTLSDEEIATGLAVLNLGLAIASEGISLSALPRVLGRGGAGAAGAKVVCNASRFASTDPKVTQTANEIEAAYPGLVQNVNVRVSSVAMHASTDMDIVLKNATIQVKTGDPSGIIRQMQISQSATGLPSYAYAPNLSPRQIYFLNQQGAGIVTNDPAELIRLVKP